MKQIGITIADRYINESKDLYKKLNLTGDLYSLQRFTQIGITICRLFFSLTHKYINLRVLTYFKSSNEYTGIERV